MKYIHYFEYLVVNIPVFQTKRSNTVQISSLFHLTCGLIPLSTPSMTILYLSAHVPIVTPSHNHIMVAMHV